MCKKQQQQKKKQQQQMPGETEWRINVLFDRKDPLYDTLKQDVSLFH